MDYQSNSKNKRDDPDRPPKVVERVVVNEVIVRRQGPWRKFKSLFVEADVRTVVKTVALDVMIPAAKNMLLDTSHQALERIFYKDGGRVQRYGPPGTRVTYNAPINRGFGGSPLQSHAPRQRLGAGTSRQTRDDYILKYREEAENVLDAMNTIIDQYQIVSVADLNELMGVQTNPVDNKWGWSNLSNVQIRGLREGFLIDFPPAEPIA